MATVLTPSLSEESFALALDAFREAVGDDAVSPATTPCASFATRSRFRPGRTTRRPPSSYPRRLSRSGDRAHRERAQGAAVDPCDGDEQRLRRAGAAFDRLRDREPPQDEPRARDQRGVRLRRRRARRALVRPLRRGPARRPQLMVSIPDLGWGSIVGNSLENGATYLPTGADMASWCGMEVVLPSGEVMRTGMGAMPDNKAWHVYKRSLGPSPISSSRSRTTASSRSSATGSCRSPSATCRSGFASGKTTTSPLSSRRCGSSARPHDRERASDLEHRRLGVGAVLT